RPHCEAPPPSNPIAQSPPPCPSIRLLTRERLSIQRFADSGIPLASQFKRPLVSVTFSLNFEQGGENGEGASGRDRTGRGGEGGLDGSDSQTWRAQSLAMERTGFGCGEWADQQGDRRQAPCLCPYRRRSAQALRQRPHGWALRRTAPARRGGSVVFHGIGTPATGLICIQSERRDDGSHGLQDAGEAWIGMLVMETIAKIRRAYFQLG